MKTERYRNEWKYLIDTAQKELVTKRLSPYLTLDKHAQNGGYMIRSLYFDDYFRSAYEEKDTQTESYKRVYPDESETTIRGKIYYKEKLNKNVVQK